MSKPPGIKEQQLHDLRVAKAEKAEAAEKSRKLIPYAGKQIGVRNAVMVAKKRKPK